MPGTFKDKLDQQWRIELNVGVMFDVQEIADVNLAVDGVEASQLIGQLSSNAMLLCRVLYGLCRRQCVERKIDEAEFYLLFDGRAVQSAGELFLEEYTDFFPSGKRATMKATLARLKTLEPTLAAAALKLLEDPRYEAATLAQIESEIESGLAPYGQQSGESPGSAA